MVELTVMSSRSVFNPGANIRHLMSEMKRDGIFRGRKCLHCKEGAIKDTRHFLDTHCNVNEHNNEDEKLLISTSTVLKVRDDVGIDIHSLSCCP